jgi:hypothetical protein
MTRTARRRWTREFGSEIDGIAMSAGGPVLVHEYDPPAGGKWVDAAIPGKLAMLDRQSGEIRWVSPCEVGYGRGFGAGFGRKNDAVVLGPSTQGHRVVRMSLDSGEMLAVADVPTFDEALVYDDVCVMASTKRVAAIDTESLRERWRYSREGERYHHVGRVGKSVFVVFSGESKRRGVLALDAASGEFARVLLAPRQREIHDLAVDERGLVLLVGDLSSALAPEILDGWLRETPQAKSHGGRTPALLALDPNGTDGDAPLWFEPLELADPEEIGEIALSADSGKLYVVRGALLEVRDTLTGRMLGEWAVPGLDESVAWQVCQGAGLLAEETRVSVFELPA